MPQNGILHEGVAALAEALKSNPNLKVVSQMSTLCFCDSEVVDHEPFNFLSPLSTDKRRK